MPIERSRRRSPGVKTLAKSSSPKTVSALEMTAEAVRTARIATGKSQSEIAEKAGTSQNQIWRLENGRMKRGPSVDLLERIAQACDRTLTLTFK